MSISFGTNGTITYLYDASGRKVKKDVQDNITSVNTVVDYLSGGFQYENAQLQFFPHAEGYVNATKTRGGYLYNYVFNYTDHLGNIRLSYTYDEYIGQLKTLEENHYYPFGLKHTNYNSDYRRIVKTLDESGTRTKIPSGSFPTTEYTDYKYKYNGKEYQDELGLNVTAMDFRQYDGAIGRFNSMDRLSEMAYGISPYRFAFNNPVIFGDPTGLIEESVIMDMYNRSGNGKTTWTNNDSGGFETIDGGYVGYTSADTSFNTSPGEITQLNGIEIIGRSKSGFTEDLLNRASNLIRNDIERIGFHRRKITPDFSQVSQFSLSMGALYLDARWNHLENIYKNGKFVHTNGKTYSQNYNGGRWHTSESIKAGKAKFNSNVKFLSRANNALVIAGAGATIYDGLSNGWENHHTADLAVSGILYVIAATNPLGWVVGGLYFVADITQAYTGKSITENLFDD